MSTPDLGMGAEIWMVSVLHLAVVNTFETLSWISSNLTTPVAYSLGRLRNSLIQIISNIFRKHSEVFSYDLVSNHR